MPWRDKITNIRIMERTRQEDLENNVRTRRIKWFGHVCRMDKNRRVDHILHWASEGRKRGDRPRKN